jgi:hypothetical protein
MHAWKVLILGAVWGVWGFGQNAGEAVVISPSFAVEGRVVKGVPYSAQAVTSVKQTLATGSEISTHFTALVARDSEGRTRREQTIRSIGPWSVEPSSSPTVVLIQDPVKGVTYTLDPARHFARTTRLNVREEPRREEPHSEGRSESLGSQAIEGVQAQGKRVVTHLAIGAIGNSAALELVVETWFSAELQVVVLGKRNDPRVGEITYRLTNIKRTEPASSLFEVPADYRVEPAGNTNELERRKKEERRWEQH